MGVGKTYLAPAKINLFLHVTGRRDDGYHTLQTAFQFISLADTLRITPRDDAQVHLTVQDHTQATQPLSLEDNLIRRAAKALAPFATRPAGCEVHLEKHIPIGAGLGGGSSDCATTLRVLNALWHCGLSQSRLAALGLALGADVPVFVQGQAAFAQGVGEALTPMNFPESWYLLAVPAVSVQTAKIFSDPQLTRDTSPCKIAALPEEARNDCEAVTCRLYPQVHAILQRFRQILPNARMSGTGGAVFAVCTSQAQALDCQQALLHDAVRTYVVQGRNNSPLQVVE